MALGNRIRQALAYRKREQKALVEAISGLTQQALSNLITRDSATSEHAIRIADALGVSIRWLLDGTGAMDDLDWPFRKVDRRRWDVCDDEERGYVQSAMNRALDELDAIRANRHRAPEPEEVSFEVTRPTFFL